MGRTATVSKPIKSSSKTARTRTAPVSRGSKVSAKKQASVKPATKKAIMKKPTSKKKSKATDDDIPVIKADTDTRILEVKTTHTADLKRVIEIISNFISDCCIVFIPPDEFSKTEDDEFFEEIEDLEVSLKSGSKTKTKTKTKGKEKKSKKQKMEESDDDLDSESSFVDDDEDTDDDHDSDDDSDSEPAPKAKKSSKASKHTKPTKPTKAAEKINPGGIRIIRLTEDKSILVKLKLDASNFNYFYCGEPKITIGVDMQNLNAMLKTVNDDDPIVMYMNRNNRGSLFIHSLSEDQASSEETDLEVFLMEIPNPDMPIKDVKFQNIIAMDSNKFHTICKQLNNNSTYCEITSINNEILFNGQSENGKITKVYRASKHKRKGKPGQVVQGVYELKNLVGFSKCKQMCKIIEIYLKNDFPLVLAITVATLGKLYVFLTPIEPDAN